MKHPVIINSTGKRVNKKKLINTTPLKDVLQQLTAYASLIETNNLKNK